MKKILLAIFMLMAMAGINNLNAQCWSETTLSWTGGCVYPDDKTVYDVNLTIIDECSTPNQTIFDETQILSTNNTSYTFCILNQLCTEDQKEPCFKVIYTVGKIFIDTRLPECRKQYSYYTNCVGLYNLGDPTLILE